MKIKRYICDKCGKEIARGQSITLTRSGTPQYGESYSWDFCPECFEEFKKGMIDSIETIPVRKND